MDSIEYEITDLQERILTLLEDAGIPTETNDEIMKLIAVAERQLWESK